MTSNFVDLNKVLGNLEITLGQKIADFGAGAGFLALELANRVGKEGTIYAIDILEEPLEVLANKANAARLFNLQTIRADLEQNSGSTLETGSCDWVIISNLLFQAEEPEKVMREALRITKSKGKIVIVDWLPEKMLHPDEQKAINPQAIKDFFQQNNASLIKGFEPSQAHYGLVFQKE